MPSSSLGRSLSPFQRMAHVRNPGRIAIAHDFYAALYRVRLSRQARHICFPIRLVRASDALVAARTIAPVLDDECDGQADAAADDADEDILLGLRHAGRLSLRSASSSSHSGGILRRNGSRIA